jgi:hypothetical protein
MQIKQNGKAACIKSAVIAENPIPLVTRTMLLKQFRVAQINERKTLKVMLRAFWQSYSLKLSQSL